MSKTKYTDKDLQVFLGRLLRYGVFVSLGVVLIGLILFLVQNNGQVINFGQFSRQNFDFYGLFLGLIRGNSLSIMALGVLLLILTPVCRVIFAIIGFHWETDRLYVIISSVVLLIIVLSIILGAIS